jgi:hypothetical protein
MTRLVAALALALATLSPVDAFAREKAGVTLPDTITVDGKNLTVNGLGLRTKVLFKVYVAGLYLEKTTDDPKAIIASDETKRVQMVLLRDLGREKIVDAMNKGFEANNKDKMPALRERLDTFCAAVPDLKKGDTLTVTYSAATGTTVSTAAKTVVIPGKDFAEALFSVWLGSNPVDNDLKAGMLGK